jgi:CubicO group peptidase (beta-lactamase class C family)
MAKKFIIKPVLSLFFVFGLICFGFSNQGKQTHSLDMSKVKEKLDKILPNIQTTLQVPGMVVGVLKDGKVIYKNSLGVRRLGSDRKMTSRSLFHMASVSKPFVATAIMQLVERGKIKLEAKLKDYLPYFKLADQEYKEITIGQMLNHTSGIPDVRDYEWDKPQVDDGAAERYVRSLTEEKMLFAPGEGFRYSNMAFDILADVIARVSGFTFEEYVKKNIFKPLGMKDSTFLKPEVPDELENNAHILGNRISFSIKVSEVYPYNRIHAPSSTLHSNVEDMMRWGRANLNGGILEGNRILKAATHAKMWKPAVVAYGNNHVGISWFIGKYKGLTTVSHGGGDLGFRTYFLMVPKMKVAITTMGNCSTFNSRAVINTVLDVMLGEKPQQVKRPVIVPVGRRILDKGVRSAVKLYYSLKEEKSGQYSFSEGMLNNLGYALLRENRIEDAIEIFQLNVKEYPNSFNTYDSLGEALKEKGLWFKALKNYKKALEMNPQNTGFQKESAQNQKKIIKELEEKIKERKE